MKVLALILGIVLFVPVAFIGGAMTKKSFQFADQLGEAFKATDGMTAEQQKQVEESVKVAYAKQFNTEFPSTARVKAGAVLTALGAIASLLLVIFAFVKKNSALGMAGCLLALFALAAVVFPHIPTGPHDGVAPRTGALIGLAFAAGQALLLVYYAKRSQRATA